MTIPYRPIAFGLFALVFAALLFERAQAGGSHFFPPVSDPVVREECGSCHLAFAPSMLPARSWQRMGGDLKNHFGDDASVDSATTARITDYLVANAADTGGRRHGGKLLRAVPAADAPLRITELPRWVKEHRDVAARDWKEARSKANCLACHRGAERGYYDD